MRLGVLASGLASVLLLSACATTSEGDDSAYRQAREDGTVSGVNEDGERVRCERVRETGTRFTTRVCHTEREWERIEDAARQASQDSQGRYTEDTGPAPGGGPGL